MTLCFRNFSKATFLEMQCLENVLLTITELFADFELLEKSICYIFFIFVFILCCIIESNVFYSERTWENFFFNRAFFLKKKTLQSLTFDCTHMGRGRTQLCWPGVCFISVIHKLEYWTWKSKAWTRWLTTWMHGKTSRQVIETLK